MSLLVNADYFKLLSFEPFLVNALFKIPKDGLWMYSFENDSVSVSNEWFEKVQPNLQDSTSKSFQNTDLIQTIQNWAKSLPNLDEQTIDSFSQPIGNVSGIKELVLHAGKVTYDNKEYILGTFGCLVKETDTSKLNFNNQYLLDKITQNNLIFLLIIDSEGNYTYANNYFLDFYNYRLDEIIGTSSLLGIIDEDLQRCIDAAIYCQKHPNEKVKIELTKFIHQTYSTAIWEFMGIIDECGTYSYTFCIGYDITDQKKHHQTLIENESLFRLLVENSRDIIYQINEDLTLQYISPSVER